MSKISLFFYALVTSCFVNAQNNSIDIPFRLTQYNNIVIPVVLNNSDSVQLMFHTGSDYISIIEKSMPKVKSLLFNDTIRDVTSWAGNSNQLMSKNNQVNLGKNHFNQIPVFIDQQSGHETDGKIGMKFFEGKYLEIDFESKQLKLYNDLPKSVQTFQKLKSNYINQTLFFNASSTFEKNKIETQFMFHTGYSGTIIYSDEFVTNNRLLEKLKTNGQTKFSDANGNEIISKTATLKEFNLNNKVLFNLPISFFDSQIKIQHINIFGGDLIKRFNWIISPDFKNIYFKPNSNFKDPYFKLSK